MKYPSEDFRIRVPFNGSVAKIVDPFHISSGREQNINEVVLSKRREISDLIVPISEHLPFGALNVQEGTGNIDLGRSDVCRIMHNYLNDDGFLPYLELISDVNRYGVDSNGIIKIRDYGEAEIAVLILGERERLRKALVEIGRRNEFVKKHGKIGGQISAI